MKVGLLLVAATLASGGTFAQAEAAAGMAPGATAPASPEPAQPNIPREDRSYALGIEMGRGLRRTRVDIDPDELARGIRDALSGNPTRLSEEEIRNAVSALDVERKRNVAHVRNTAAAENRKAGEEFLAANKKKEGVKTLPSGLQYRVVRAGSGRTPALDDTVVCHFRGTLVNGVEFDNTYERSRPLTLPVKNAIRGWSEALQHMPVGSRWQLFVPAELAYGAHGSGELIGPNSALIFDVELISIVEKR